MVAATLLAGGSGGKAAFIGGTTSAFEERTAGRIDTSDARLLTFSAKAQRLQIAYDRINQLEYGQKVDRRYISAMLLSPLFLLAKSRKHFLTIGYTDRDGEQQALIFQVEKGDVRAVLVGLEARTGRKITFQDEEARKAGKG